MWYALIPLSLWLGLEFYVFKSLRSVYGNPASSRSTWKALRFLLFLGFVIVLATIVYFAIQGRPMRASTGSNLLLGLSFTFLITKFTLAIVLLLEDLFRLGQWLFSTLRHAAVGKSERSIEMLSRRRFLSRLGLILAAIPFSSFLYGITKGKYAYQLHKTTLHFPDLPPAFDGFRIVQLSDVHSGSFDDAEAVQRGLELVGEQQPDLLLFTGDLVNDYATEIVPYKGFFSALSAPLGKFSVLGNHDYGEYPKWNSQEERQANFEALVQHHADMGFDLLRNRHVRLERNGESLVLAGVENWGRRPFPQYGDLDKALEGVESQDFVLLMSHDPTHWDEKVLNHPRQVHLTMSGHTHGAQMGVEIPGVKWSPSSWVYPRWAGLYKEGLRYLYVNRGFGFIGFPGRVGIWPEIALIELRRA